MGCCRPQKGSSDKGPSEQETSRRVWSGELSACKKQRKPLSFHIHISPAFPDSTGEVFLWDLLERGSSP